MIFISIESAAARMNVPYEWVEQMLANRQLTPHSDGSAVMVDETEIECAGWSALPVAPYRHTNDFMVQLGLRILH